MGGWIPAFAGMTDGGTVPISLYAPIKANWYYDGAGASGSAMR